MNESSLCIQEALIVSGLPSICIYDCPHCGNNHFTTKEHVDIDFISEYLFDEGEISYICSVCKKNVKKDELKIGEKPLNKNGLNFDDWDFDD